MLISPLGNLPEGSSFLELLSALWSFGQASVTHFVRSHCSCFCLQANSVPLFCLLFRSEKKPFLCGSLNTVATMLIGWCSGQSFLGI